MRQIQITVRCEKQPTKHAKVLRMDPALGMDYARTLAGLLDGSSAMYVYKPGPDSPIGKCATCGGRLTAEVEEVDAKPKQ